MSDVKEKENDGMIDKLRKTLEQKKAELEVEKKKKEAEDLEKKAQDSLPEVAYDIVQDPAVKSRAYLMTKIQYSPETGQSRVVETRKFEDKVAGLAFTLNRDNLEYLFNKCKKGE